MAPRRSAPRKRLSPRNADRHDLYQRSVQAPDFEVTFLDRIYREHTGRPPMRLREDFCGTAILCASWVKSKKGRDAVGLDIDRDTLAWGQARNIDPLGTLAKRVSLRPQNVLLPTKEPLDVVVAFNYSYQCFHDRPLLLSYFRAVYTSLPKDGLFVLDMLGGWESQEVRSESTKKDGFTYIWDQAAYDPVTARLLCYIHFRFPGGGKMRKAFTYDWRLWQMVELRELLLEAGFISVDSYFEGDGDDGTGDGVFRRKEKYHNDPAWNAYLVAKKRPSLKRTVKRNGSSRKP